MGPRNRTPWNLIHNQQSSLLNRQTWHHVLEKFKSQISNINVLQAPFQCLLFKSGQIAMSTSIARLRHARESQNRDRLATLTSYSPPMRAPFSATERFINKTAGASANINMAKIQKQSK